MGFWIYEQLTKECNLLTHRPEGGFYIFLDFEHHRGKLEAKGITTSKQLAKTLLEETGIAVLPGEVFGRVETELTFRLSYVNFDGAKALKAYNEGATVDEGFLKDHCPDAVEGIQVLIKWVQ